jgi:hypothetical protein
MDLNRLAGRLQAFAQERDWEQFHTPKNLAMALSVEAGELLELFQWLTPTQSFAVADYSSDSLLYSASILKRPSRPSSRSTLRSTRSPLLTGTPPRPAEGTTASNPGRRSVGVCDSPLEQL